MLRHKDPSHEMSGTSIHIGGGSCFLSGYRCPLCGYLLLWYFWEWWPAKDIGMTQSVFECPNCIVTIAEEDYFQYG